MLYAEVNFSSALSQLEQLWTDIKTAKPFAVCPTCQGQVPDKCTLCRGRGLISEYPLEHLRDARGQGVPVQGKAESGKQEKRMSA